jgi:hypothetical protein
LRQNLRPTAMSALIPRRAVTRLPIDVAGHIIAPSAFSFLTLRGQRCNN